MREDASPRSVAGATSFHPTVEGPFFYLSYAHSHRHDGPDPDDPDQLIGRLFKDLCDHISDETGLLSSSVGFMDRELRPGNEWPWHLSQNLATCRVFVPLYSGEIGQIYAEHGFYGIMKLTRFSEEYEWAVYNLAERISDCALSWSRRTVVTCRPDGAATTMGNPHETGIRTLPIRWSHWRNMPWCWHVARDFGPRSATSTNTRTT